jgi:NADH-quinone oxidoreductase subunit D
MLTPDDDTRPGEGPRADEPPADEPRAEESRERVPRADAGAGGRPSPDAPEARLEPERGVVSETAQARGDAPSEGRPATGEAVAQRAIARDEQIPAERLVPEEVYEYESRDDLQDFLINIGPHHPGTHGVLRVITRLDGEKVVGMDVRPGYMHRSLEKIAENRTYHQVVAFTDRTVDYLAAMHNDWVYCMAAEELLGVEVPERAEYLRIITGELNRITSHLLSLGALGLDSGATTYFLWAFAAREKIVSLFEELCGARLTYVFSRIGGVMFDAPQGWPERTAATVRELVDEFPRYRNLFHDNYIWHLRSKDISVLSREEAMRIGAQGPILRGSGIAWDLRKNMPYSIYDRFEFDVPVGVQGDVYDRTEVRYWEMIESAKIVQQALADLPGGPVLAKRIPRVPAPPPGEAYARLESPRGEIGCYLVSDGTHKPYRMKWRGASFHNVAMLPDLSIGYTLSDMINVLGTIDPVMGDVDR